MSAGPQAPYQPPRQGARGQLVDAVTIIVLIFATLFVTTYLATESTSGSSSTQARPLTELPLNPGERAQYQKVIDSGTADLPAVAAAVDANQPRTDKYDIDLLALLGTAALLALYLGFVYRMSFREYREVIEEKFGPAPPGTRDEAVAGDDR